MSTDKDSLIISPDERQRGGGGNSSAVGGRMIAAATGDHFNFAHNQLTALSPTPARDRPARESANL